MFGYSTPTLQKLATRLVSQCASSTGCERNWSTFAFIHTKVRNRLSYNKLHKLVYVNYNLRIQNNIDGGSRHDDDFDPFARLMELTLVDASNPIREWMEGARSTNAPELDDEDTESDPPIPSPLVTTTLDSHDLQRRTGSSSVSEWARKTIGDSHVGKRKSFAMQPTRHSKRLKGKASRKSGVSADATTDEESPPYQESNDSSSNDDSDDGDDTGGGGGGGMTSLGGHEGGEHQPLSPFTADQYTHVTQDQDHGMPTSQRIPSDKGKEPADSSESSTQWTGDVPLPGPYHYNIPDAHNQTPTRWVYEWVEPELYTMLYHDWQTTAEWTHLTWQQYKAQQLQNQGIMLMSTEEYYSMQHMHRM